MPPFREPPGKSYQKFRSASARCAARGRGAAAPPLPLEQDGGDDDRALDDLLGERRHAGRIEDVGQDREDGGAEHRAEHAAFAAEQAGAADHGSEARKVASNATSGACDSRGSALCFAEVGARRQRGFARVRFPQGSSEAAAFDLASRRGCPAWSPCAHEDTFLKTGTVKWFNPTKAYGFIQPDGGGADAFVHISAVERAGYDSLSEGQRVQYELVQGRNGKSSAENLKIVG